MVKTWKVCSRKPGLLEEAKDCSKKKKATKLFSQKPASKVCATQLLDKQPLPADQRQFCLFSLLVVKDVEAVQIMELALDCSWGSRSPGAAEAVPKMQPEKKAAIALLKRLYALSKAVVEAELDDVYYAFLQREVRQGVQASAASCIYSNSLRAAQ